MVLGLKPDAPIRGVRYFIIRVTHWITSYTVLLTAASTVYISHKKPKYCYKKYLGPDWEPDYDTSRLSTVIINHSSFLDSANNAMQ